MSARLPLRTERLRLRLPEMADAPLLLDYYRRNAERFRPWEPLRPHELDAHRLWIAERRASIVPENAFLAFDAIGDPDALVAVVALDGFSRAPAQAMIGYTIDAAYEGRGLASEAVGAVAGYAFSALELDAVSAYYHPNNRRSERLVRRLGFREMLRNAGIPGMEHLARPQVIAVLDRATYEQARR